MSDTVGFIQKLPTELVAAFRATLEEIQDAALILHVVDISHPHAQAQSEAVCKVLRDLQVRGGREGMKGEEEGGEGRVGGLQVRGRE